MKYSMFICALLASCQLAVAQNSQLAEPAIVQPYYGVEPANSSLLTVALEQPVASNDVPTSDAKHPTPVRAYPNPANHHVTIELPTGEAMESMIVLDSRGRIVRRYSTASDRAKPVIDVSGFDPGYYLVHLRATTAEGEQAWHTQRIARF